MKKGIMVAVVAIASVFTAQAHDHHGQKAGACKGCNVRTQSIKPKKGDVSTEFVLSLKGSDPLVGLRDAQNGSQSSGALRGRYFVKDDLAIRGTLGVDYVSVDTGASSNTTSTSFLIGAGVEKHFKGTNRLSPYVGGELTFGHQSIETPLATTQDGQIYKAAALVGADYYVLPKVFIGLEAGLSVGYSSATPETTAVSTGVVGGLRLGFTF